MFRDKNCRWEVSVRCLVKRQWTEHWQVYIGLSVELHWSIQVTDLARCPGKQQVSLNGDNVILFSNSTSDFVWVRSLSTLSLSQLQMCLSCLRMRSTRNLLYVLDFLRCSCQNILKGKWVLRSSEIQRSNKISLYKQSDSNVFHQQSRKIRVRHLLLGSHHSKVEIIQQSIKVSFPNLNMIGRLILARHFVASSLLFLEWEVLIHVFIDKKNCASTCQ